MNMVEMANPDKVLEMKLKVVLTNLNEIQKDFEEMFKKVKKVEGISTETRKVGEREQERNRSHTDDKKTFDSDKAIMTVLKSTGRIADVGVGFLKKTFGLVESLYAQLKKSSPLLQAIEQLFNLAWTLFFMPIGNKLGEMLIPAVIQLMDDVMDIWDAFDGMSIGEMLEYAITKGVEILSRFIITIGEQLSEQSGLVGSIGNMLLTVGNFLQKHGEKMLDTLSGVAGFIFDNIKQIIALIVAFKAMSATLALAQIYATYSSQSVENKLFGHFEGMAALAVVAGIGGLAGTAAYVGMNAFAEGGYVPATPGGQLAIIGEGGEGEYVIPESKLNDMGSHYTVNVYSYSTEETKQLIKDVVSDEISKSRLRSGY